MLLFVAIFSFHEVDGVMAFILDKKDFTWTYKMHPPFGTWLSSSGLPTRSRQFEYNCCTPFASPWRISSQADLLDSGREENFPRTKLMDWYVLHYHRLKSNLLVRIMPGSSAAPCVRGAPVGGTPLRSSRAEFLNSFRWAARSRGDVQHIFSDFPIPSGNETWLAGKSPANGGFNGKSTTNGWFLIFSTSFLSLISMNFQSLPLTRQEHQTSWLQHWVLRLMSYPCHHLGERRVSQNPWRCRKA